MRIPFRNTGEATGPFKRIPIIERAGRQWFGVLHWHLIKMMACMFWASAGFYWLIFQAAEPLTTLIITGAIIVLVSKALGISFRLSAKLDQEARERKYLRQKFDVISREVDDLRQRHRVAASGVRAGGTNGVRNRAVPPASARADWRPS